MLQKKFDSIEFVYLDLVDIIQLVYPSLVTSPSIFSENPPGPPPPKNRHPPKVRVTPSKKGGSGLFMEVAYIYVYL